VLLALKNTNKMKVAGLLALKNDNEDKVAGLLLA